MPGNQRGVGIFLFSLLVQGLSGVNVVILAGGEAAQREEQHPFRKAKIALLAFSSHHAHAGTFAYSYMLQVPLHAQLPMIIDMQSKICSLSTE